MTIRGTAPGSDLPGEFAPGPEFFVAYRDDTKLLEDIGMYQAVQSTARTENRVDRLFMVPCSSSLFTTLGAQPLLGRLPNKEDDLQRAPVMVISHWLWTTWFASEPAIIGRSFEAAGARRTVIGVMPPEFRFPGSRTAIWARASIADEKRLTPGRLGFQLVARMKPGGKEADLTTQLATIAKRLPERFGGTANYARLIEQHRPVVRSLEEAVVGNVARPLHTENIFTFQVAPQRKELNDGPSFAQFHQGLLERLAAMPGVESVGLVNELPLDEGSNRGRFATESTEAAGGNAPLMPFSQAGGDYFKTMRIPLVAGRLFERDDNAVGRANVIVSRAAAQQLWPNQDPIGKRVRYGQDPATGQWLTVVGVVGDVRLRGFRQEAADPMIYLPMVGPTATTWAVGSPAYVVKSARAAGFVSGSHAGATRGLGAAPSPGKGVGCDKPARRR